MRSSKINIIGLFACLSLTLGCVPHQASNPVLDPDIPAETPQSSEFIFPTEGQITQYFNPGHAAIDIARLPGDEGHPEIMAVKAGTVSEVQINDEKDGNFILIDHGDGLMTRYAHLEEVTVKEGDTLIQGQVIGTMGNTGHVSGATGIHVHFELIKDGEKVNPMDYLPQQQDSFGFVFQYGAVIGNKLNTFTDTYTKDMVLDSALTVPMTLSSEVGIPFSD